MSLLFLIISLIGVIAITSTLAQPTIWPLPQVYTNGSNTLTICQTDFEFTNNIESTILNNAITRFNNYLNNPPSILTTQNIMSPSATAQLCSANIRISSSNETLSLNTNESYTLHIESTSIMITARTIYGAMFALTTLQQLIRFDPSITTNIICNIPWSITDYPIYKHRGVMIDPSRNFLSVNKIKQVLKGMAMNKLNVLHIHLTDAQSFPFFSKSHPELSEYGAYSTDKIYHPTNLSDIVLYAKNFGIRIIPEFDTPGHTFAIQFGDPSIMECVSVQDNNPSMCPEPPCGYLNVTNQNAYNTIMDVYKDSFEIFSDEYFHIGGDEVKDACWGKNTAQLYTEWIATMCNNVHLVGKKTPILWSGDVDISAQIGQNSFEIIMQIWDNAQDKLTALKNGFKVIDSIYTSYYLDCGFGSWLTGGNSWCDPYKTWLNIYNHSLTDGIPAQYFSDILGGEVCLWGESVDDYNLEPRLWPRAAAGAERWWRNKPLLMKELDNAFYRIAMQRDWMVYQGIIASPVQPEFCTLYPDYCNYYRDAILASSQNDNEWKNKLIKYKLHEFVQMFEDNGWDIIEYWKDMSFEIAKEMGFKSGHWVKFKHLIKDLHL